MAQIQRSLRRSTFALLQRGTWNPQNVPAGVDAAFTSSFSTLLTQQHNPITMDKNRNYSSNIPEYWGRDSPYHPGTEFLGTPKNHLDLVKKRPLSPHVFEIDEAESTTSSRGMVPKFHYKMPLGAVSSVTNRATGVMLSLGAGAAGWAALSVGDLATAIASFKEAYPLLVVPAKFAVSFPLLYHYLGGLRHLYWDHYKYGNQSDRDSPLEYSRLEQSSKMLLMSGGIGSLMLALYSL